MRRPESRARARALQLLYAWEAQGRPELTAVAIAVRQTHRGTDRAWSDGELMAARVAVDVDRLDQAIADAAAHWRLQRIGVIERNILRLGLAELEGGEAPAAVVIDEAVKLAHSFAGPKAPAFVNGVLDQMARRLGRL